MKEGILWKNKQTEYLYLDSKSSKKITSFGTASTWILSPKFCLKWNVILCQARKSKFWACKVSPQRSQDWIQTCVLVDRLLVTNGDEFGGSCLSVSEKYIFVVESTFSGVINIDPVSSFFGCFFFGILVFVWIWRKLRSWLPCGAINIWSFPKAWLHR